MELSQAIALIDHKVDPGENVWADIGCGDGLFTNALSQLLPKDSWIYAVDKNKSALDKISIKAGIRLEKLELDFIQDKMPFRNLSGILIANALHYVQYKHAFIQKLVGCLQPGGYFLIVEYERKFANHWVPYPINFEGLKSLFGEFDYSVRKFGEMSSQYGGNMYAVIGYPK